MPGGAQLCLARNRGRSSIAFARRLLGAPRADSARGTSPCLSMSDAIDCPPNVLETGQFPRLPPRTSPPTIAIPPTNPVSVRDPASPGSPVRCPCGLTLHLAVRPLRPTKPAPHSPRCSALAGDRPGASLPRRRRRLGRAPAPFGGPCARRRREPNGGEQRAAVTSAACRGPDVGRSEMGGEQRDNTKRGRKPREVSARLQISTSNAPPTRSWDDLWAKILRDVTARLAGSAGDDELEAPAEPRADVVARARMERG